MIVSDVSHQTIGELVSLYGRVAVITGGAQGIGFAIANRFSEAGANVIIADSDIDAAASSAQKLTDLHERKCIAAACDVSSENDMKYLADHAVREFGSLHIWVNNAGIYPIAPLLDVTASQWERVLDVNLKGAFLGARQAARQMIARGERGVIINLASVASYRASSLGGTEYVAAKHGVCGLTKSLAAQLGPNGIRVLALAPSTIETPGIAASRKEVEKLGMPQVDANQERPLGRDGVPDDVARVALFCASDLSLLMTGSTLAVDGGILAIM